MSRQFLTTKKNIVQHVNASKVVQPWARILTAKRIKIWIVAWKLGSNYVSLEFIIKSIGNYWIIFCERVTVRITLSKYYFD